MGTANRVVIPYAPRRVFLPYHDRKQRWSVMVAHRRAGKTVACVNDLIRAAITCPLPAPRFAYVAPTYSQAKDVAWSYLTRFTAPIPGAIPSIHELRVDLPTGARIRLYGADNYERLRGLYFDGVVLDEFGDIDPRAWSEVVRPALSDRKGWAAFIGTPKGNNHFAEIWDAAEHDPTWFRSMLRASETGILDADELADARRMMTADQYAAEYECSFAAGVIGAYYGHEMTKATEAGRICRVPWEPRLPVHTVWDLGMADATAIWFVQYVNGEVRLIDYLEANDKSLNWYVNALRERPYTWGQHWLPHDVEVAELGTGASRKETLESLGIRVEVTPRLSVAEGISAVQMFLPRCWFDAEKCAPGIKAMRNYRREWDDSRKVYRDRPLHDWSSHAADAFRYLAIASSRMSAANDAWSKPLTYDARGIV